MRNKDLIKILEAVPKNAEKEIPFGDAVYGEYSVLDFLRDLKKKDPNGLVMISNGECEQPGVYAPSRDGKIDFDNARPVKEGESFPDNWKEWVRIAYLPSLQNNLRPSCK